MSEPIISVIIPVYKVEKYLHKCVSSVMSQSYKNLEIILIDDGSPDNCPKLCDDFALMDSRIKVIHKTNGGLSSARNAGLDIATGDYIAFVDSDDWVENNAYEEMLKLADKSGAEIVCCGAVKTDGEKDIEKCFCYYPTGTVCSAKDIVRDILTDKIGSQVWRALYSRKCWEKLRFPDGRLYEDIPTTFKAYLMANKVAFIDECYYKYRMNMNGISLAKNPLKPYHIFLGFQEIFEFAKKEFFEVSGNCCARAAHFAISTCFNYYISEENRDLIILNDAMQFLIDNKKVIKNNIKIIPFSRRLALNVYYISPNIFKVFCSVFGKFLSK